MEPTMPLRLQDVYGYNSLQVGLIFLAANVPTVFCASLDLDECAALMTNHSITFVRLAVRTYRNRMDELLLSCVGGSMVDRHDHSGADRPLCDEPRARQ
jgi:hypothetical protein